MSVYATSHVWNHSRLKGNALLLVLALADQANDQGISWPSMPTLAHKARMTERTVQNQMPEILASGEVELVHEATGPGHPRVYRVVVPPVPASRMGERLSPIGPGGPPGRVKAAQQRVKSTTPARVKNLRERVQNTTPKGESFDTLTGMNRVNRSPVEPPVEPDSGRGRERAPSSASLASKREQLVLDEGVITPTGADTPPPSVLEDLVYRIHGLADEFGDPAVAACIAQAQRMYESSSLDFREFDNACKLAAYDTRRRREDASKARLGTPMAYFFHALKTAVTAQVQARQEAVGV